MSDCTIFEVERRAVTAFVAVEHGGALVTISLNDGASREMSMAITPAQARVIAAELIERADKVEKGN